MKNKIIIFGLTSVLTIGTTVSIFAKDRNARFTDKEAAITEEVAKKIAMDSVIDGIFVEIELEDEDSIMVYEVKVKSGGVTHEIEIDSNTGAILKDDIDKDDQDEDEVINVDVKLTENEAIEIAKNFLDGKGEVTEIELKKEDGVIIYDIDLNINNKEVDMEVDANTGEILSQEYDNDDDQSENENGNIDSEKDKD